MYKSFKFVLFNKSFPNLAKFQIRPNFGRSRISAGFVKKAGFWPEPNSGTALNKITYYVIQQQCKVGKYQAANMSGSTETAAQLCTSFATQIRRRLPHFRTACEIKASKSTNRDAAASYSIRLMLQWYNKVQLHSVCTFYQPAAHVCSLRTTTNSLTFVCH